MPAIFETTRRGRDVHTGHAAGWQYGSGVDGDYIASRKRFGGITANASKAP